MPNIQYEQPKAETFVSTAKSRFFMPHISFPHLTFGKIGSSILYLLKLIVAIITSGFVSIFSVGIFSALSSNITLTGIEVQFDPMITLTCLVLVYLLSYYYQLNRSQGFRYFVLALILSYTTPFLQSSIFLLLFIPTLRWLKLMTPPSQPRS